MKFDYIVGNPPYQYPKGSNAAKKLYIDITVKVIPLISKNGIISFITPFAIMQKGRFNKAFNLIENNIMSIDFDTNKKFNIGQNVVSWTFSPSHSGKIKLIESGDERYVTSLQFAYQLKHKVFFDIFYKVDITKNNRPKLRVSIHGGSSRNGPVSDVKTDEFSEPVWCNTKKQRIKYCKPSDKKNINNNKRLVVHYIGGWEEGCFISDIEVLYNTTLSHKGISLVELENMRDYLNSKLISYVVVNYSKLVKMTAYYNGVAKLPELDFIRKWTDADLYREFNITDEEQKVIEEWYIGWKNKHK